MRRLDSSASRMCSDLKSHLFVEQRLQKRAERFNLPATSESKKAMRAARSDFTRGSFKGYFHFITIWMYF